MTCVIVWLSCLATIAAFAADKEATLRRQLQLVERQGGVAATLPVYERLLELVPDDVNLAHRYIEALAVAGEHRLRLAVAQSWLDEHPDDRGVQLAIPQTLISLGDTSRAVQFWRQLLEAEAVEVELCRRIIQDCLAAGLPHRAGGFILQLRHKMQESGILEWEMAAVHLATRSFAAAGREYIALLRRKPGEFSRIEGHLRPFVANTELGKVLVDGLFSAINENEKVHPVRLLIANMALEAGQLFRSLEVLRPLGARGAPLYLDIASRAQELGHRQLAADAYDCFANYSPQSPFYVRARLSQAENLIAGRGYDQAAEIYRDIDANFPDSEEALEALYQLGTLQLEVQRDVKAARATLQQAVEIPSQGLWRSRSQLLLVECSLRLEDWVVALADLNNFADSLLHMSSNARHLRAELFFFQGLLEDASQQLDTLVTLAPKSEFANDALELLLLLEGHGDSPEAIQLFARAQLAERQGRSEHADRHWQTLLVKGPAPIKSFSLLIRARLRASQGQHKVALALYDLLVRSYPYPPHFITAQTERAELYERMGDLKSALKTYETALLGDPEDVRAPHVRLQIERLRLLIPDQKQSEKRKQG